MLSGSVGASLLGNVLVGKSVEIAEYGNEKLKQGQGTVRDGYGSSVGFNAASSFD